MVGVLEFSEFTNLFQVSFLAFLKVLCLMALLRWKDLSLFMFVGSRRCFLYSALTIFSSLSQSSFHHATGGLGEVLKVPVYSYGFSVCAV